MVFLSKKGNIGIAIICLAGFWLGAAPAVAQPSDDFEAVPIEENATETSRAEQPCDCSCGTVSEAKEEETNVIYVGPRQNIPMRVKRRKD